jgi:hypothetical protein
MKMTVVLDQKGEIVAVQQGPIQNPAGPRGDGVKPTGGLVAGPGQRLEERDVPDHLGRIENIENIETYATEIRAHLTA